MVWQNNIDIYLYRDPVDFRKVINGLSLIVSQEMMLSPFDRALFVFYNKRRTQLKVLYWDNTGFALWQKRLEKKPFKGPKHAASEKLIINHEPWCWLLRGVDHTQKKLHQPINIQSDALRFFV